MKPESDPPTCPDCGKKVRNRHNATITPVGVFHSTCDVPSPSDL